MDMEPVAATELVLVLALVNAKMAIPARIARSVPMDTIQINQTLHFASGVITLAMATVDSMDLRGAKSAGRATNGSKNKVVWT